FKRYILLLCCFIDNACHVSFHLSLHDALPILTGFDAPTLNTLFVDKNLRYHGLMQAFSRTNRIYDANKTFGNIVTFRDLEKATIDAITLFGDQNTKNVVLEKSYQEYLEGFMDIATGEAKRGYVEVVKELNEKYHNPEEVATR